MPSTSKTSLLATPALARTETLGDPVATALAALHRATAEQQREFFRLFGPDVARAILAELEARSNGNDPCQLNLPFDCPQ